MGAKGFTRSAPASLPSRSRHNGARLDFTAARPQRGEVLPGETRMSPPDQAAMTRPVGAQ